MEIESQQSLVPFLYTAVIGLLLLGLFFCLRSTSRYRSVPGKIIRHLVSGRPQPGSVSTGAYQPTGYLIVDEIQPAVDSNSGAVFPAENPKQGNRRNAGRFLLLGFPGIGKSSFLNCMARDVSGQTGRSRPAPVFVSGSGSGAQTVQLTDKSFYPREDHNRNNSPYGLNLVDIPGIETKEPGGEYNVDEVIKADWETLCCVLQGQLMGGNPWKNESMHVEGTKTSQVTCVGLAVPAGHLFSESAGKTQQQIFATKYLHALRGKLKAFKLDDGTDCAYNPFLVVTMLDNEGGKTVADAKAAAKQIFSIDEANVFVFSSLDDAMTLCHDDWNGSEAHVSLSDFCIQVASSSVNWSTTRDTNMEQRAKNQPVIRKSLWETCEGCAGSRVLISTENNTKYIGILHLGDQPQHQIVLADAVRLRRESPVASSADPAKRMHFVFDFSKVTSVERVAQQTDQHGVESPERLRSGDNAIVGLPICAWMPTAPSGTTTTTSTTTTTGGQDHQKPAPGVVEPEFSVLKNASSIDKKAALANATSQGGSQPINTDREVAAAQDLTAKRR